MHGWYYIDSQNTALCKLAQNNLIALHNTGIIANSASQGDGTCDQQPKLNTATWVSFGGKMFSLKWLMKFDKNGEYTQKYLFDSDVTHSSESKQ
jgi:hypothetical protein